jgi:transposase InsO family protein
MSWSAKGLQRLRADFVMIARDPDVYMTAACRQFGISRKTGYKWLARHKAEGLAGLADRSRRPWSSPLQLSGEIVAYLVQLHGDHPDWGPKKLRARLSRHRYRPEELPSLATVARLARRLGWSKARGRGRPPRSIQTGPLSAAGQPNDVWTVDFKGWWRTRDGRRCEPLTIRDLFSRYILCLRPMARRNTGTVRQAFVETFARYGLPDMIRSDNGGPFASRTGPCGLTRLSAWWRSLGIRLERIAPGHPEQNGGHERMHGDIARAIESSPAATVAEETERLECWRIEFNVERPHEALGMKTPGEVYRRSRRRLEAVQPYVYPPALELRRVRRDGCIRFQGRSVYLSEALGKQEVGLEQLDEHRWRVWFCDLAALELERFGNRFLRRPATQNPPAGNENCNPCPDNYLLPMSRS